MHIKAQWPGFFFSFALAVFLSAQCFVPDAYAAAKTDEYSIQYLAIHQSAPPPAAEYGPSASMWRDADSWSFDDPISVKRGWDRIINAVGTKGTATRKLALHFTFCYFQHSMANLKAALQYYMQMAEEKEVPIYIGLDGISYWRNTGLWNWWNDVNSDTELLARDPGIKYDPDNVKNVAHYGWGLSSTATATKVAWRDWSMGAPDVHRLEYRNGMGVPAPNTGSPAFRQKNKEALAQLLPLIVSWYNALPSEKKYLLAGVVIGLEMSIEINSFFYWSDGYNDGKIYNGNDLWDKDPALDASLGMGNSVRISYAAAESGGIQSSGTLIPGTRGNIGTIDKTQRDYFDFIVNECISAGLPAKKLITHAFVPVSSKSWFQSFNHLECAMTTNPDVVAGYSNPLADYKETIKLDQLGGREWAGIETHFHYLRNDPAGLIEPVARDLAGLYKHGKCRHISLKNWDFPIKYAGYGYLTVINKVLSETDLNAYEGAVITFPVISNDGAKNTGMLIIPAMTFGDDVTILAKQHSGLAPADSNVRELSHTNIGVIIDAQGKPAREMELRIPYNNSDITGMNEESLVIARYDEEKNVWVPLKSTVDINNKQIIVSINKLSVYAIMGTSNTVKAFENMKYYPNPLQPSKGLNYSKMHFSNIPAGTRIKIYTMLGRAVRELEADASGMAVWDGKNNAGAKAASGVYIVYMKDGSGNEKRIKIAVER
ncbi:MAG: T9SS type A sorting domain-containing protein [Endomicrobia bacterium]|nr:T9SS type A sorting domain-containing protein [Endomicrobiia bacterium]